ncbi:MAG: type II toxin-antitoxin system RelE/ParE family toxin [Clostridia bacterium]|nr:type II toxin-antitoxin system RelE/ParE family toxin [Clostridia bacterium]
MYNVIFYEDKNGYSELYNDLMELAKRSSNDKDARIQFKQITYYIELLKHKGTRLTENITKHLQGEIWELRPGSNRVLYFYFENDTYVLLHMFKKKTRKTPRSELEKAIKECNDYKERNRGK